MLLQCVPWPRCELSWNRRRYCRWGMGRAGLCRGGESAPELGESLAGCAGLLDELQICALGVRWGSWGEPSSLIGLRYKPLPCRSSRPCDTD